MVQSLNTKVDITKDAVFFSALNENGQIMVGDRAFEFYSSKNANKYIQIPWTEVELVSANVFFKGKWISRFAIQTKRNGNFQFSTKDTKAVLRAMQPYVPYDRMIQANSAFKKIRKGISALGRKK